MKALSAILSLLLSCCRNARPLAALSAKVTPTPSFSAVATEEGTPRKKTTTRCDAAIVGAGPAGLVLAHALIDRGYAVRVLERRSSFRPVGSAVFLHPFAIRSLRYVSPTVADNLLERATQVCTMSMRSVEDPERDNLIVGGFDEATEKLGAPFVVVKFWDMLQALKEGLPEDIFQFGCDVQGFVQDEDGVHLNYVDETTTKHGNTAEFETLKAGVVLDAGGIRSNLRRQLVPDKPSIPRCRAYMTVLPAEKAETIIENSPMVRCELGFYQGGTVAMTMSRFPDGDVWWTYTDVEEDINAPAMTKAELVECLSSRFPPFIKELVEATNDFLVTMIAEHPITWKWGESNVTMLGDAAHAQMPALGLGCSTAFADIGEICRQVDRHGLTENALRWYERIRKPQAAVLQLASRASYFGVRNIGSAD